MNFYAKWATISAAGAIQELQSSSANGLNVATVTINLKKYGKNSTSIGKRSHFLNEIGKHLKSPLLILLIVATIISYSLGETANATIILFIIIVSVGIDYFQDRDARNAAERLKETVKNKSSVVRNGKEIEIFHEEIVVGDIVLLSAGKIIPADGKIIEANDCFVNQSSLTGESFPAQKNAAIITGSTSNLSDLCNIVFMGSSVISGMARIIIIQTGNNTEFGKIAIQLSSPEIETEFSKGIRAFGYLIMKVTIVLVLFIFLINSILKHDILETFMFSLAVAVGLTPELLPMIMAADIGISVSNGTDVAKDAADIILTQKNLLVLKEGILEGRKTFGNTMKYILMGLSSNFGNMFSVAAATLFLPYIPMLPVQILLNNFLYDTSQIAIPTDSVDEKYIQKPKHWNIKMIYSYMFIFGITSSLFDIITFYLLYSVFKVSENQLRTGWFMESLATQILVVFIIRTREIPFIKSKPSKNLTISVLACLLIGWLLPYSPFGNLLHFQPLPNNVLTIIIVFVVVYLFTAEVVKQFIYKFVLKEIN